MKRHAGAPRGAHPIAPVRQCRKSPIRPSFSTAGTERCAKKFGEEAVEAVIAAMGDERAALKAEAADVLYHLLVLLESRDVAFDDVFAVLEGRMGTSGLEEKAARNGDQS